MMIMQPDWVTEEGIEIVKMESYKKKKLNRAVDIRFESMTEGLAVQILYTGTYIDEAPTIAEMHNFIRTNGYRATGKHHEIYLGDPRKTPPERLQTILRQPIQKI
jgi:hypothetical protein